MAIYKNNTEVKNIYMVGHGLPDINAVGLQEDVDYVRYKWLVGHAKQTTFPSPGADIRLDIPISLTDKMATITMGSTCRNIQIYGSSVDGYQYIIPIWSYASGETWIQERHGNDNTIHSIRAYLSDTKKTITLDFKNKVATVGSQSFNISGVGYKFQKFSNGYWSRTRVIGNITIDNELNLVPCRLLHPIPASLDTNNRARQEGEYGMIDLVSKKFYGNVDSSGSFTGEGLITKKVTFAFFNGKHVFGEMQEGVHIRRYGWLKGDAVAYINTNYLLDFDDIKTSIFRLYNNQTQVFEGSRYGMENNGAGTVLGYNNHVNYASFFSPNGRMAMWNKTMPINVENTVVMSKNGITLNGSAISSVSEVPIVGSRFESVTPYLIFASWIHNWQIDDRRQKVDYKSFEIGGKLHLTPCKLLRPIPPELDANGIARAAGVCGMYDEVNHKFYGNVGSGTFTVEGMAEGYDYEVYQYLVGDGSAYATVTVNIYRDTVNTLIIPTSNVPDTKIVYAIVKIGDTNDFVELATYIGSNRQFTSRYTVRLNGEGDPNTFNTYDYINKTLLIKTTRSDSNYVYYLNGSQVAVSDHGQYVEADMNITPKIYANGCKLGYFSTSGSNNVNLMPCKLLRAIPAELDANGIARNAEECGMVDTYSGLFYGNVNTGGSFTVSDS